MGLHIPSPFDLQLGSMPGTALSWGRSALSFREYVVQDLMCSVFTTPRIVSEKNLRNRGVEIVTSNKVYT